MDMNIHLNLSSKVYLVNIFCILIKKVLLAFKAVYVTK